MPAVKGFREKKNYCVIHFCIPEQMTEEPEMLLNRGGEDNCISRKENRENVTGIDKSRQVYICEAGEGVLSGLDSHGPEEVASSNAHYCSVGTDQTKEKVTQTTKNGGEGKKVQMKEAISNRERAVKQMRSLWYRSTGLHFLNFHRTWVHITKCVHSFIEKCP